MAWAALWANFLIAMREGVEASLIIGIIIAYIYKVGRKDVMPKLWVGVIVAALIPLGLGAYWTWGPITITFQTQEILGGSLSIVAVALVTWMIFWMGKNSRRLSQQIAEEAEEALEKGNTWGLIWMAIIAVIREGAETAIMVWGVVKSTGTTGVMEPTVGVVLGIIVAIVIGYLVYKGSTKINLHKFFSVTGYFLIFIAAGILMYGVGDLQEASVISGWGTFLYDFSAVSLFLQAANPVTNFIFVLLNAFFNIQYVLSPTLYQFIAWAVYLAVVLTLFTLQVQGKIFNDKGKKKRADAADTALDVATDAAGALDAPAGADATEAVAGAAVKAAKAAAQAVGEVVGP